MLFGSSFFALSFICQYCAEPIFLYQAVAKGLQVHFPARFLDLLDRLIHTRNRDCNAQRNACFFRVIKMDRGREEVVLLDLL